MRMPVPDSLPVDHEQVETQTVQENPQEKFKKELADLLVKLRALHAEAQKKNRIEDFPSPGEAAAKLQMVEIQRTFLVEHGVTTETVSTLLPPGDTTPVPWSYQLENQLVPTSPVIGIHLWEGELAVNLEVDPKSKSGFKIRTRDR